jgi:hypothetical protein
MSLVHPIYRQDPLGESRCGDPVEGASLELKELRVLSTSI